MIPWCHDFDVCTGKSVYVNFCIVLHFWIQISAKFCRLGCRFYVVVQFCKVFHFFVFTIMLILHVWIQISAEFCGFKCRFLQSCVDLDADQIIYKFMCRQICRYKILRNLQIFVQLCIVSNYKQICTLLNFLGTTLVERSTRTLTTFPSG